MVSREVSVTSYALLGLLDLGGPNGDGITGYELKQRADRTLRFYWTSPAMSQVYSELTKLTELGLVDAEEGDQPGTTTYRISARGRVSLRVWMTEQPAGFPVLKHPVALRLLMGSLSSPEDLSAMLEEYVAELAVRREELREIRESLGGRDELRYPAMVADWGLAYYDSEAEIVRALTKRVGDGDAPR